MQTAVYHNRIPRRQNSSIVGSSITIDPICPPTLITLSKMNSFPSDLRELIAGIGGLSSSVPTPIAPVHTSTTSPSVKALQKKPTHSKKPALSQIENKKPVSAQYESLKYTAEQLLTKQVNSKNEVEHMVWIWNCLSN